MKSTARTAHANPQHDSQRDTTHRTTSQEVANNVDIYDIDELGPTTGTVFQIFANNNQAIKINTLFDTGAMKSVMSLEMYEKLKLDDLNTTSIPHSSRSFRRKLRSERQNQMRNKHQRQVVLSDFYRMRTPKKTDYPRKRFLDTKLHRHILDKKQIRVN